VRFLQAVLAAVVRTLLLTSTLLAVAAGCGGDGGGDDSTASASLLEDTSWMLVSGEGVEIPKGVSPSATFAGGSMAGSTGCNRYSAPYAVDGDKLQLDAAISTKMACPPALDALERSYLAALDRVERWQVEDEVLSLSDGDGNELLRFQKTAGPVGSWRATGILEGDAFKSLVAGTEITATFGEDGTLTGSAGCNSYQSRYVVDRGRELTIELPLSTRSYCAMPKGVMKQEQSFLSLLPEAFRFQVDGRMLELTDADGKRLVDFERKN
jgi:heat shock protein HslJ